MRASSFLMILLILGIAVRLAAAWGRPADLLMDIDGYLAHAEMVKNGEGFAGPYTHRPTAFRPPAYPIALGGLLWLGLSPAVSVIFINGLSSVAIMWCIGILSRQLQLTPVSSCLAIVIAAFDPLLVRYTILPMTEVPTAVLLIAAVVALNAADQRPGTSKTTAIGFLVLAGVFFGLGSLVRPILLVSCAMLCLRRVTLYLNRSSGFLGNSAIAILPMIVALVAISPWIVRNAVQFGKFIPATTHGGYTLALGNNPDFYRDVIDGHTGFPWPGPQLDAWQQRMIADSAAQGVPGGDEPAQDAWYYQQAIAAIKAQPVSFLKSCLLRLRRFWAITPGTDEGLPPLVTTAIAVWYGLIGIGLVAAIWNILFVCLKPPNLRLGKDIRLHPKIADLWLIILSFMLLHSVYWTDARMRAPVMPLVAIIAVVGWQSLTDFVVYCVTGRFTHDTHSESPASSESPT